jgi:hypothetical protein
VLRLNSRQSVVVLARCASIDLPRTSLSVGACTYNDSLSRREESAGTGRIRHGRLPSAGVLWAVVERLDLLAAILAGQYPGVHGDSSTSSPVRGSSSAAMFTVSR